jgi:DNA polymerase-4
VDVETMAAQVTRLAAISAEWLTRKELWARTVTVKVRYADFTTVTRSLSCAPAIRESAELESIACALLWKTDAPRRPVRLLGVSVHNLVDHPHAVQSVAEWPRLPFDSRR